METDPRDPLHGARPRPHRAVQVLVLGILSLACCQLLGPIAWLQGREDLERMDAGRMDPEGRSLTQAGKICGIIASVGLVVYACFFLLALLLEVAQP